MLSASNLNLKGKSGKLKPRFVGPFQVLEMVGSNAARLQLPATMKIHPVFNVGLLKKYQGDLIRPDPVEIDGELEYEVD